MTLGHALFYLAANPEYIGVLREEIEDVLDGGDLTYESLNRMRKLDSFIRETQRLSALGNLSVTRVAVKDFIFSDGTRVPAGDQIQGIASPIHLDATHYEEPHSFKPWRFCDMSQAEIDEGSTSARMSGKYDMVQPSKSFMVWGIGRHACPGRWYAAMVIKHLMAYIVLNYDIRLPDSAKGKRPANLQVAGMCLPNRSAKLLFKRRFNND